MAFGKTLEILEQVRINRWRVLREWEPKDRDRSLRGKARIKARKAENKRQKALVDG